MNKIIFSAILLLGFHSLADCELYDDVVWSYSIVDGDAYLYGMSSPAPVTSANDVLRIPSSLGGCPVVEIEGGMSPDWNTELVVPASVTSVRHFSIQNAGYYSYTNRLQRISVDSRNTYYKSIDGCLYTKDGKTFVRCPQGRIGKVTVASGVQHIADHAFYGCFGVTEINLPNSVISIGNSSFNCSWRAYTSTLSVIYTSLTKINIPSSVRFIGDSAFQDCSKLDINLVIPEGVQRIGSMAFSGCSSIRSLSLPSSLVEIGYQAFNGCAKIGNPDFDNESSIVEFFEKNKTEPIIEWAVEFDGNGIESSIPLRIVQNGLTIGQLPDIERDGYTFDGWYTAAVGGSRIVASTVITSDVICYAHWIKESSSVITKPDPILPNNTFIVSAVVAESCEVMGKVTGGKTAKAGTKLTLKATANKGYVFSHWEGPIDDVDPRSPSVTYVVGDGDVQFMAHFVPVADDIASVSFAMKDEYVTGDVIASVTVDVSGCTSLPTVKVTGLPAGLKFTAKPIYKKGSKTEVEVPANTIYGTPTKSGVYTIVATVTTAGKKTATCSQTVIVRKSGEKVVVAECDAIGGKATGGGVYATGKNVALKATPNKGYVFAGWYEDASFTIPCDSTLVDYRTASYSYTMGNMDKTFYARFIPVAEDTVLDLTVDGENVSTTFTISEYAQLSLYVDSLSLSKISVKGLPAGMKFTAKPIYKKGSKTEIEVPANTIYGTPTKPGLSTVIVSLSNQSIKKAIEKNFSIEVPNLTGANSYFDNLDNGAGKKRVFSVGITNIADFLPSLKLNSPTAKLAVSGLPSGLKYDATNGKITGVATKVGTYTVTLTVTNGKEKYVSTITVEVEALPDWIVGTFDGYVSRLDSIGNIILTIGQNGKVTAKERLHFETKWVSLNFIDLIRDEGGCYKLVGQNSDSDMYGEWVDFYELQIVEPQYEDGVLVVRICGRFIGEEYYYDGSRVSDEGDVLLFKNIWESAKGTKLAPEFVKNATMSVSMDDMYDDEGNPYYGGYLTLKYGANGAVTTAYSETVGGKATATGSAQLVPYEVDGNITKAWLYTALKPKGRDPFGVLLFLSIDTSNGNVYGEDVVVDDYLLEVDE